MKTKNMKTKKIMTKYIRILAALLTLGAAMTACSGDDIIDEQHREQTPETYTITVKATKDLDGTRGLELSGSTLNAVWEVGEKVMAVQNNASDVPTVIGELTATAAGTTTTLTGTVNSSFDPAKALKFYLHSTTYDYTDQDGTLSTMGRYQTYASCEKTAGDISVSGSTVTISGDLGFANAQAVVRFNLVNKATGNPIKATSLTVHDAKGKLAKLIDILRPSGAGNQRDNVIIRPASASNLVFASLCNVNSSDLTLIARDANNFYTFTKSGVTFQQGRYYEVKVEMTPRYPLAADDPGVSFVDVGSMLASNGYLYASQAATPGGNSGQAVIAYVGDVDYYWTKFIAIALEDATPAEGSTWSDANDLVDSYAAAHPITVGGSEYNVNSLLDTFYDMVEDDKSASSATATALHQGWRLPTVTDWRYILAGLCEISYPTPTTPDGVCDDDPDLLSYGSAVQIRNIINAACGNTALLTNKFYMTSSGCTDPVNHPAWGVYPWACWIASKSTYWAPFAMSVNNSHARAVFAY